MMQDRMHSSQMERWRGQRAGVTEKREEIGTEEFIWERDVRGERKSLCSPFALKHIDFKHFFPM